jgi:putative oxidoreductase
MIARSATFRERTALAVRLYQIISLLDRFPPSILQLIFRVAIASVFWSSGLTKIASWDTTIALFRDEYMVPLLPPEIAAAMSATFELSCSVLIVLGLATRLATLPLLAMTLVIEVFVYPEYWTQHLMWASVLLFLLTKGPGVFSLDQYAERFLRAKDISADRAPGGETQCAQLDATRPPARDAAVSPVATRGSR